MKVNYLRKLLLMAMLTTIIFNARSQGWEKIVNKPNATFTTIQKEAEAYFDQRGRGKGTGYKQYQRWRLYNAARLMPNGTIADVRSMNAKGLQDTHKKGRIAGLTSVGGSWTSLGPTKILNGAYQPGQGRVNRLAVDPSNASILYAGTPRGGLWKTVNGGTLWTLSSKGTEAISGIVVDPNSPAATRTIYVLTGDADAFAGNQIGSDGVMKSTDGGVTWGAFTLPWGITSDKVPAYKMINDPANGQVLFVVSSKGIHKSINGASTWATKKVGYFYDIVYKPGSSTVLYAAANEGVYKSTNSGESWTLMTSTLPVSPNDRIALGVSPANPNYLYVYYGDPGYSGSTFRGLYRSTDGGITFQERTTDSKIMDSQASYDLAIAVSPTNAEEVYVGAVNGWKSTDGGSFFNSLANGELDPLSPRYVHADFHAFLFAGTTLYAATDGGVFKTTNGGTSWTTICDGLDILEIYHLSLNPNDPSVILAGTQDNGTVAIHTKNNIQQFGGDGFYCFFDPTNANRFYGSYNAGNLLRGEQNWAQPKDPAKEHNINYLPAKAENTDGIMDIPFLMDPLNPKVLYAGYKNLYKSSDRGANWTNITTAGVEASIYCNKVAICETNPNRIYISKHAEIWTTQDGGANWSFIEPYPGYFGLETWMGIQDMEIHPTSPMVMWKVFGGYAADRKVFVTKDGGTSWDDLNPNNTLPNVPILSIVYHKGSNGGIYIGTDVGIYYRDSTLTDWIPFSNGMPLISVRDLAIDYKNKKLIAATYGRGVWTSDLYAAGTNAPVVSITYPTTAATIAANPKINVEVSVTITNPIAKVELYHGEEKIGEDNTAPYNITWNNATTGTYTLVARATDKKGIVSYSAFVPVTINSSVTLPSPWVQGDIGTTGLAGSGTHASGTFNVKGSGADIWGTADAFHYVYQPVNGNVEIIAKINSISNTNGWAKGGVMIRETLSSNSKNAFLLATPTTANGLSFQTRATAGATTIQSASLTNTAIPIWLKLKRTGNVFTVSRSADGITWTVIGSPVTIAMTANVYVGMALTAHNSSAMCTASFSNVSVIKNTAPTVSLTSPANKTYYTTSSSVPFTATAADADGTINRVEFYNGAAKIGEDFSTPYAYTWPTVAAGSYTITARAIDNLGAITNSAPITVVVNAAGLPTPWIQGDIGTVGLAGSGTYSSGTFTVKGAGADIYGTADAFHYVYQPIMGNVEIIAKVNSITNTHAWAKGGVMIRETLAANSKQAMMIVSPTSGVSFQRRTATGGSSTSTTVTGIAAPVWVKLNRTGDVITVSQSANGTTWTVVGAPTTITMTANVYVGMALCSHNTAALATAPFSSVRVNGVVNTLVANTLFDDAIIGETEAVNSLSVFPNPSSNKVTVNGYLNVEGIVTISLYNSLGDEVLTKNISSSAGTFECELEIAHLPVGIYSVKAAVGETVLLKKVVKN